MNWLKRFLTGIGDLVLKAIKYAHDSGLDDKIVKAALAYIKTMAGNPGMSNEAKRQAVATALAGEFGISESLANYAIETAFQIFKREG